MYLAQTLVSNIKKQAKVKNVLIRDMLTNCGLSINAISQISDKKGLSSFSLALIADYLDCSVDYLLGRTDNPDSHKASKTFRIPYSGEDDIRAVAYGLDNKHYIPEDDEDEIKTT